MDVHSQTSSDTFWTADDEAELLALAEPTPQHHCPAASKAKSASSSTRTASSEAALVTHPTDHAVCAPCRQAKTTCAFDAKTNTCVRCASRQIACAGSEEGRPSSSSSASSTKSSPHPLMGLFTPSAGPSLPMILRSPDRDELPTVPLEIPRSSVDRATSPSTGSEDLTPLSSPTLTVVNTPEKRPLKVVTFASPLLSEDDLLIVRKRPLSPFPTPALPPAARPSELPKPLLGKRLRLVACATRSTPTSYLQLAGNEL